MTRVAYIYNALPLYLFRFPPTSLLSLILLFFSVGLCHVVVVQQQTRDEMVQKKLEFSTILENYTMEDRYEWCISDAKCKFLFHQNEHKSKKLFLRILKMCWKENDLLSSYQRAEENIHKEISLLTMKLWAHNLPVYCSPNHYFVMDEHGTGECVCKLDRVCNERPESEPVLDVVIVLICILLIILIVGGFCCKDKYRYPPLPPPPSHSSTTYVYHRFSTQQPRSTQSALQPIKRENPFRSNSLQMQSMSLVKGNS